MCLCSCECSKDRSGSSSITESSKSSVEAPRISNPIYVHSGISYAIALHNSCIPYIHTVENGKLGLSISLMPRSFDRCIEQEIQRWNATGPKFQSFYFTIRKRSIYSFYIVGKFETYCIAKARIGFKR